MYGSDPVYGNVVDSVSPRTLRPKRASLEMISGGERRDWFFSVAVAGHKLDLPHLYLYKDQAGVPSPGTARRSRRAT